MMPIRYAALTLAAALVIGPAAGAASIKPRVQVLSDGTELVFLKVPRAETTSIRLLVHTGSASDPKGKEGMAHLLEHIVFQGTYSMSGEALLMQARWAGAVINGITSPDTTVFSLDAPSDRFELLLPSFLTVVTDPAISLADVHRELGVIATESYLFSRIGILWVVDHFVFPGVQHGATTIGTEKSRSRIRIDDLMAFYAQHYRPSNMTFVFVGDCDLPKIVDQLEQYSLLAPEVVRDQTQQRVWPADVPVDMKFLAPITATVYGYRLDEVDHEVCLDLARLLDLRLTLALTIDRTLVSGVTAQCVRMRGNDFVFAIAYSKSFQTSGLPDVLRRTFRAVQTSPPTWSERDRIKKNYRSTLGMALGSAPKLAEMLSTEVSVRRSSDHPPKKALRIDPPRLVPGLLAKAARDNFVDANEILLFLSPFAG